MFNLTLPASILNFGWIPVTDPTQSKPPVKTPLGEPRNVLFRIRTPVPLCDKVSSVPVLIRYLAYRGRGF